MSYQIKKFHLQRKVKAFKFLIEKFELSMKESQRWIDKGRLFKDGSVVKRKGEDISGEIEVVVFSPKTIGLKPIFQTPFFAVFDKPSGVLVHPASRKTEYSLTHEAKYLYGKDANIVHRLDKETSGLVIVSKSRAFEKDLKQLFENREINKGYIAIVNGHIDKEMFIDEPIEKSPRDSNIKLKVRVSKSGRESQTIIRPISYDRELDRTYIEAIPLTGRQHQIRVHLFHVKHPIVGDPIYGVDFTTADNYLNQELDRAKRIESTGADRLMLHANWLEFKYKNRFKLYSKQTF